MDQFVIQGVSYEANHAIFSYNSLWRKMFQVKLTLFSGEHFMVVIDLV